MKYLILFFLILISGCASNTTYDNNSLTKWFTEYKSFYETKNEDTFFNPSLWNTIKKSRLNNDKSGFSGALSKFPKEMIEVTDYKESINEKGACLLVSGVNSSNIPMDYYLRYKLNENRWIINEVTVKYYLDGTERYLNKAVCDEQERMRLWLQYMEQKE